MESQEIVGMLQGIGWNNSHPLLKQWLEASAEALQEYDSCESWCCGQHYTVEVVKNDVCVIVQDYCRRGRGSDKATTLWRENGTSVVLYTVPPEKFYGPVANPQCPTPMWEYAY